MFRFAAKNVVFWPVELSTRGAEGEPVTAKAYIGYRILERKELRARDRAGLMALGDTSKPFAERIADADRIEADNAALLRERIVGWREIVDNDDVSVPFSAENVAALLADDLLFKSLLRGLFEASRGAREKNLLPGPGGTPVPAQITATTGSGIATNDGATSASVTAAPPAVA